MTLDKALDVCQSPFYSNGAAISNGRLYAVCSNQKNSTKLLEVQSITTSEFLFSSSLDLPDDARITMLEVDSSSNRLYLATYAESSDGAITTVWSLDPTNGSINKIIQGISIPLFSVSPEGNLLFRNSCREILVYSSSGQLISKMEVQMEECLMYVVKLESGRFVASTSSRDGQTRDIVEIAPSGQVG